MFDNLNVICTHLKARSNWLKEDEVAEINQMSIMFYKYKSMLSIVLTEQRKIVEKYPVKLPTYSMNDFGESWRLLSEVEKQELFSALNTILHKEFEDFNLWRYLSEVEKQELFSALNTILHLETIEKAKFDKRFLYKLKTIFDKMVSYINTLNIPEEFIDAFDYLEDQQLLTELKELLDNLDAIFTSLKNFNGHLYDCLKEDEVAEIDRMFITCNKHQSNLNKYQKKAQIFVQALASALHRGVLNQSQVPIRMLEAPNTEQATAIRDWCQNPEHQHLIERVTYIKLSAKNLSKLPAKLTRFINLQRLYLAYNRLTRVDEISELTNLVLLDLSNNHIEALDLLNLPHLQELYASGNRLQALDLSGQAYRELRIVHVSENALTCINVAGLTSLTVLDISNNQLKRIDNFKDLQQIGQLYLQGNRLTWAFNSAVLNKSQVKLKKFEEIE